MKKLNIDIPVHLCTSDAVYLESGEDKGKCVICPEWLSKYFGVRRPILTVHLSTQPEENSYLIKQEYKGSRMVNVFSDDLFKDSVLLGSYYTYMTFCENLNLFPRGKAYLSVSWATV